MNESTAIEIAFEEAPSVEINPITLPAIAPRKTRCRSFWARLLG
jgi:hypothetical protein